MDDTMGALIIERIWAADGQQACRIRWTSAQLRRIGQAVQAGDQLFLASVEEAMRKAFERALTPQRG